MILEMLTRKLEGAERASSDLEHGPSHLVSCSVEASSAVLLELGDHRHLMIFIVEESFV